MKRAVTFALLTILSSACSNSKEATPPPAVKTIDVTGIPSQIRVLVAPSRTHYYLENGVGRGLTAETGREFETWLNAQAKPGMFHIDFIETPEHALIPDLLAGKGDIAANLLLTFERDDQVAFAKPLRTGIREVVVTGPKQKPLASLEDVGDRTIHVRKSSDHYASLLRLNDQLIKINRRPAKVVIASAPTDEDLLEMVNAGTIPATIVDDYIFNRWRTIFTNISANPDVAVSQDGSLSWVTRKDMPKMLAVMNEFFSTHKLSF